MQLLVPYAFGYCGTAVEEVPILGFVAAARAPNLASLRACTENSLGSVSEGRRACLNL